MFICVLSVHLLHLLIIMGVGDHCRVLTPSSTMQFVILTYMKHLGVKVKEPRGLDPKPKRINFNLPKIKVGRSQRCQYGPLTLVQ